jgi:hypothetical protein
MEQRYLQAGESMQHSAAFTLPPDFPATTPPDYKEYPRYAWAIRVIVKIANSPDYQAKFPVVVDPPGGR